jgi:4-hydroxybenzoate polyprenyltransferase
VRGCLQLARPANVVTAVADVLAGYAIAGRGAPSALSWVAVATACLYAGGVVLNDVFDRDLDRIERPERPIPSCRVSVTLAASLGGGLLAAGIAFAAVATRDAGAVAAAIVLCVLGYDAVAKRHDVAGPVVMGACRGLNLCLGMAAVAGAELIDWPPALLSFGYIVAVTALSRGEVHGGRRVVAAASFLTITAIVVILAVRASHGAIAAYAFIALFGVQVLPPFWRALAAGEPAAIRAAIRAGVLSLVVLDASLAAIYAGAIYGLAVLSLAIVAYGLARLFAVT